MLSYKFLFLEKMNLQMNGNMINILYMPWGLNYVSSNTSAFIIPLAF